MNLKQRFCKHDFKCLNKEVLVGTTLNWSLRLTNEYENTYICQKCKLEEKRRYIYYGNIK